jgi:Arc/MetJ-type ribon-helix-helix transcriptional regulator
VSQINIQVTPGFDDTLRRFMRLRRIKSKSEAIRTAVAESLQRSAAARPPVDYRTWLGVASQPPVSGRPRFASHGALWER